MAIEIRFATPEDADRCNEFHNRCYGSNRTASQWKWEFCSHPHKGRVVPFVLAEVNGRVVGTQALIPIAMIDAEEVFWTAKLEETLVDPAYRRYQVFIQMYEKLFRYAEEHGLVSIWGFTEIPQVFEGLLGFQIPANTQQLFRPLRRSSVSQLLEQYLGQDRQKRPRVLRGPGEPLCAAAATFGSSLIAGLRGWRPWCGVSSWRRCETLPTWGLPCPPASCASGVGRPSIATSRTCAGGSSRTHTFAPRSEPPLWTANSSGGSHTPWMTTPWAIWSTSLSRRKKPTLALPRRSPGSCSSTPSIVFGRRAPRESGRGT